MVHASESSVRKIPDLQERLGEVRFRQEPPAGADRRPAEVGARLDVEDLDDQGVPGARVANLHGAGERMATERATAQDVLVGGRLRVEAVGGIASLEDDAVAGVDREPR